MLKKKFRVRKQKEFELIFNQGRKIKSESFLIIYLSNNLKLSRFAFIVSAKIDKKAVARNKIKRRLREIVRKNLSRIRKGYDFIVIASPRIKEKSFQEIKDEMEKILSRNKLLI